MISMANSNLMKQTVSCHSERHLQRKSRHFCNGIHRASTLRGHEPWGECMFPHNSRIQLPIHTTKYISQNTNLQHSLVRCYRKKGESCKHQGP